MSELRLNTDGHIIKLGADNDVTLTHVHNTGLLLNSTMQLQFNDASQNINAPSATVLDINATDEIELNATAVDLNANLDVSGTTLLPTLGVITAKDLGVGIHIRTSDSGASVSANADDLIIESAGTDIGMSILSPTNGTGQIVFGDSGDNDIGQIYYSHDDDTLRLYAGANRVFSMSASEVTVNEDSDDVDFRVETNGLTNALFLSNDNTLMLGTSTGNSDPGGITANQGANDNNILAFKSSDVAHGITDLVATDTYFKIGKFTAATGGANIMGLTEDDTALFFHGIAPSPPDSQNANSTCVIMTRANDTSGTGPANVTAAGNIFGCQNGGNLRFVVRGDGEIFSDIAANTYDTYDDAQLARAYDLSHGRGVIDSKFDKFVSYNHEHLAELNLVGREEDGTPNNFINVTGMQRLHNGAIWQQYEKHNRLLEAVYELAEKAVGKKEADAILDKHEVKRLN